jgi:dephospho-CoA kinase
MKVFGLTGGIGMGKSAAAEMLSRRGVPVVDTDLLARQVVERGRPALQEIQRAFGDQLVGPDGQLRRDELARIVFADPSARQKLEGITHPRIRELWRAQIKIWATQQKPLAVIVIPLLFETEAESELDATICVACSPATQRQRLLERGWTPAEIQQRIDAQWPIERKMNRADHVVWNEAGLEVMEEQLDRIFAAIKCP